MLGGRFAETIGLASGFPGPFSWYELPNSGDGGEAVLHPAKGALLGLLIGSWNWGCPGAASVGPGAVLIAIGSLLAGGVQLFHFDLLDLDPAAGVVLLEGEVALFPGLGPLDGAKE